jgi:hypothetical protein
VTTHFRIFALLALSAVLAACAGQVPKIDVSPTKLSEVKTIAVIRPPEPKSYHLSLPMHAANSIGFVGGIAPLGGALGGFIAAAYLYVQQDRLYSALKAQGAAFASELADRVAAKLVASGYDAKVEEPPLVEADEEYNLPFEKIDSTADAVLLLSLKGVGFIHTGAGYVPYFVTVATLLGKDRKEQMYRGYHVSGSAPEAAGWRITPPSATFANFDAVMSDTKASAAALSNAVDGVAETVTADLRK